MEDLNEIDEIVVTGGRPLHGTVRIQGSKNTALPVMAAALLSSGTSVLRECPKITDVFLMEKILRELGARTWWEGHDLYLDCSHADGTVIPEHFSGKMRSSVILMGAMLGRNGKAQTGYPGGCVIGKRPVDLHIQVLQKLGARIVENGSEIQAACGKLKGAEIIFPKSSVGATEQGILAAVLAEGKTVLSGCAREPEINWLCQYLTGMGARIEILKNGRICIEGVKKLHPGNMPIPPDRIVAGTYLMAAAATRGEIILENPPLDEMDAILEVYRKMGGQCHQVGGKLIVNGKNAGFPLELLETDVYPGFPTDLQSPAMAVLATIPGVSRIREKIFEDRYKLASWLCYMGAKIEIRDGIAVIHGGYPLKGCTVEAEELRGGAALVITALAAEGVTRIRGCSFIERGYEHICEDLTALGGLLIKDRGTL